MRNNTVLKCNEKKKCLFTNMTEQDKKHAYLTTKFFGGSSSFYEIFKKVGFPLKLSRRQKS